MSKMITNLVTTVLYEADKRIDLLTEAYFNTLKQDLQNARDLVYPGARLLDPYKAESVVLEVIAFSRFCALQRSLREWYEGAPDVMAVVPANTIGVLQRLDEAMTPDRLEHCVNVVIEEVLEKCPNWTFGAPPVEAEVLPPSTVDATDDADIPHTTDTGEDAEDDQTQAP